MCDTLVSLSSAAARGGVLFAKNSDRERNEAQRLTMVPAARRADPGEVRLTYLAIPQAKVTHACILSQPFWMWGAEMGANEHGVVIGNEALHAKTPAQRRPALTGMDLVRLALERASTAAAAVAVIIELLERHGQGGDCGHLGRFYYNNGFIIADPTEAYVMETAGRWWALERVTATRALSNAYNIARGYSAISADLERHARAQGWAGEDGRFDVAERLIDEARDAVSFGRGRCERASSLLQARAGGLTPAAMMAILRDHGDAPDWSPANTQRRTLCMHAAQGERRSQSVASMVSELRGGRFVHWFTATSAPCTSLFKPVLIEAGLPCQGAPATDRFDPESLWWRHELLHRAMLRDFGAGLAAIEGERDTLEAAFIARIDAALDADAETLRRAVDACWRQAADAEARWLAALDGGRRAGHRNPAPYAASWSRLNHVAAMPRARIHR
ncbi:MAG: carcinine hydrolase/isopenicillin-N N-acyltransferase family protein [Caulobacterales bacterium]